MKKTLFDDLINHTKSHGIKHHAYIDKLTIYFDAKASAEALCELVDLNKKNKLIKPCTLQNSIHMCQKLDLFQIESNAIKCLEKICNTRADYRITYVEFALDFYGDHKENLFELRSFFNKHLAVKSKGKAKNKYPFNYFSAEEGDVINTPPPSEDDITSTHYYSELNAECEFVVYNDESYRWDKIFSSVHLEHKFNGSPVLKKNGVVILNDLITFDHECYWQRKLILYSPILKELGKQKSRSDVSNQALNKSGNNFFKKMVSLQSYLNEDNQMIKCFSPIVTSKNLNKFLPDFTD